MKKTAQPQIETLVGAHTRALNSLQVRYCPDDKLGSNVQGNIVEYREIQTKEAKLVTHGLWEWKLADISEGPFGIMSQVQNRSSNPNLGI